MACARCGNPLEPGQASQTQWGWMHPQCAGPPAGLVPGVGDPYAPMTFASAGENPDVLPTWWIVLLWVTVPVVCIHAPISLVARILSYTWMDSYPNKARTLRKHQLLSSLATMAIFGLAYLALNASR